MTSQGVGQDASSAGVVRGTNGNGAVVQWNEQSILWHPVMEMSL